MLPREKLVSLGVESLTMGELFAIILGSGTSKKNVFELSKEITSSPEFKKSMLERRVEFWTRVHGIGITKATRLVASVEISRRLLTQSENLSKMENSKDVFHYLQTKITGQLNEHFYILCLNTKNQIIFESEIHRGHRDFVITDMKDIFSTVLQTGAKSFIAAHNHPSGDPNPSEEDRVLTKKLIAGSKLLDISCLDHVIVTQKNFYSFCEKEGNLFS